MAIESLRILDLAKSVDGVLLTRQIRQDRSGVIFVRSGASREISVTFRQTPLRFDSEGDVVRNNSVKVNFKYLDREEQAQKVYFATALLKAYGYEASIYAALTETQTTHATMERFGRSGLAGLALAESAGGLEEFEIQPEEPAPIVRNEEGIVVAPF